MEYHIHAFRTSIRFPEVEFSMTHFEVLGFGLKAKDFKMCPRELENAEMLKNFFFGFGGSLENLFEGLFFLENTCALCFWP